MSSGSFVLEICHLRQKSEMSEKIKIKALQPILTETVPTPEELATRIQTLKFPVISGNVRSLNLDHKKWSRNGQWKIEIVFYVDQKCEDKVHGSDGLRRAMIFLTLPSVSFFRFVFHLLYFPFLEFY